MGISGSWTTNGGEAFWSIGNQRRYSLVYQSKSDTRILAISQVQLTGGSEIAGNGRIPNPGFGSPENWQQAFLAVARH